MRINFVENRFGGIVHYMMSYGNDVYVPRIGETVSLGNGPRYIVESIHFDMLDNILEILVKELL